MSLNLGTKSAYVSNSSGLNFEYDQGGIWYDDSTLRSEFDYSENISAGYAELNGKKNKFTYKAGLRYEWTVSQGLSLISNEQIFDRNYQNIFPNLILVINLFQFL